jgi:hypothetical protein
MKPTQFGLSRSHGRWERVRGYGRSLVHICPEWLVVRLLHRKQDISRHYATHFYGSRSVVAVWMFRDSPKRSCVHPRYHGDRAIDTSGIEPHMPAFFQLVQGCIHAGGELFPLLDWVEENFPYPWSSLLTAPEGCIGELLYDRARRLRWMAREKRKAKNKTSLATGRTCRQW